MSQRPLWIRGGMVVEPGVAAEPFRADILVEAGKIRTLVPDGLSGQEEFDAALNFDVLDASGCYVLPGGVDPHTHFELVAGGVHVMDDFYSASRSALCGGNTSIVEHPGFGPDGCEILHQMDAYQELARGKSFVDYGLHLVFQPPATSAASPDWKELDKLPQAVEQGYTSGKAYTTYAGMLEDRHLLVLMERMKEAGCLLAVHCENDAIPAWSRKHEKHEENPSAHPASRPPACEEEAVTRILALARTVDIPVYIVHVSTAGAVEAIRQARKHGQKVYAETCPQYLLLTEDCYRGADGIAYVMAPPLRRKEDCQALWEAVANGDIDVVATDHCAYSLAQKRERGSASVFSSPGGVPGVETRLPLLFTYGVLEGRISWQRFVELTARNPAHIFGMQGKGRLEAGYDADILVLDPRLEKELSPEELCHPCDYTPFGHLQNNAGKHTVMGWPRHVLLRGVPVLHEQRLLSESPRGKFLRRRA